MGAIAALLRSSMCQQHYPHYSPPAPAATLLAASLVVGAGVGCTEVSRVLLPSFALSPPELPLLPATDIDYDHQPAVRKQRLTASEHACKSYIDVVQECAIKNLPALARQIHVRWVNHLNRTSPKWLQMIGLALEEHSCMQI